MWNDSTILFNFAGPLDETHRGRSHDTSRRAFTGRGHAYGAGRRSGRGRRREGKGDGDDSRPSGSAGRVGPQLQLSRQKNRCDLSCHVPRRLRHLQCHVLVLLPYAGDQEDQVNNQVRLKDTDCQSEKEANLLRQLWTKPMKHLYTKEDSVQKCQHNDRLIQVEKNQAVRSVLCQLFWNTTLKYDFKENLVSLKFILRKLIPFLEPKLESDYRMWCSTFLLKYENDPVFEVFMWF